MTMTIETVRTAFQDAHESALRLLEDARVALDRNWIIAKAVPEKVQRLHLYSELASNLNDVVLWLIMHEAVLDGTLSDNEADIYSLPVTWDFSAEHDIAQRASLDALHPVIEDAERFYERVVVLDDMLHEAMRH